MQTQTIEDLCLGKGTKTKHSQKYVRETQTIEGYSFSILPEWLKTEYQDNLKTYRVVVPLSEIKEVCEALLNKEVEREYEKLMKEFIKKTFKEDRFWSKGLPEIEAEAQAIIWIGLFVKFLSEQER